MNNEQALQSVRRAISSGQTGERQQVEREQVEEELHFASSLGETVDSGSSTELV